MVTIKTALLCSEKFLDVSNRHELMILLRSAFPLLPFRQFLCPVPRVYVCLSHT